MLVHNTCNKAQSKKLEAREMEMKYGMGEGKMHEFKKTLTKTSKVDSKLVGNNPDILVDRSGNLAYQGTTGANGKVKGFQDAIINVYDVIKNMK